MLERVRFVLVRPQTAGNVGGVCRAMMNMGLSDLQIVSPACDLRADEARARAMRAAPMLDAARIVATTADATAGCVLTFATSGKGGFYRRQASVTPAEAAAAVAELAPSAQVAFVFGPEDRGLTQEEILEFDRVVEIPANPEYPALNLAAAATIIAYELRLASLRTAGRSPLPATDELAGDERKRVMFAKLYAALEQIGFFDYQQNPDHLKYALRRVLGRAPLSINEVDILIGMAQQIDWAAQRAKRK